MDLQNDLNSNTFNLENMNPFYDKFKDWINKYNEEGKGSNKVEALA